MSSETRREFAISDNAVQGKIVADPYHECVSAVANHKARVRDAAL